MAVTARELITKAYYLSQVVARELQTVSGSQITDGLYLLNALLDVKASDLHLIPYFQEYEFSTVQGTEAYSVPNLVYVDTMTFNIGDVRYSLIDQSRKEYFASPRIDNVESIPYAYRIERELDGSSVYLYFVPAAVYVVKIWGKFGFTNVTLDTDLSLVYDKFYIEYLRFALGEYICIDYGSTFPELAQMKYRQIVKKLMMISPADLTIQKQGYFTAGPALDWQMINIPGWQP
jgi:hypothetical protein